MSDVSPGPWELRHEAVGVGCGFTDEREFVVDANGDEVTGTIGHVTRIVPGAKKNGRPVDISRLIAQYERVGRRYYIKGEPFPYSDNARRIAEMGPQHETTRD